MGSSQRTFLFEVPHCLTVSPFGLVGHHDIFLKVPVSAPHSRPMFQTPPPSRKDTVPPLIADHVTSLGTSELDLQEEGQQIPIYILSSSPDEAIVSESSFPVQDDYKTF